MKGKEGAGKKEIIHGVQIDAAHGGNDEHQEKEEEQRDGSKEADLSGKRSGLQLLRHRHSNAEAGDQVVVSPSQIRARVSGLPGSRGECIFGKIYFLEVSGHVQAKLAHLFHAATKAVIPALQPLRTVIDAQANVATRGNQGGSRGYPFLVGYRSRGVIDRHHEVVIDRLLRRKFEAEQHGFGFAAGVVKVKGSAKIHFVQAVPEQSFLAVFKIQVYLSIGAIQGKRNF